MENNIEIKHDSAIHQRIDELEREMLTNYPLVDCPLKHRFVPGMYIREIFMPKGALITSLIHKTEHPFFVLKGIAHVKITEDEWQEIAAPHSGTTYPGTRRVLYIEEDCIWITVHKTDIMPIDDSEEAILAAADLVVAEVTEEHENKLLGGVIKNNVLKTLIDQN